ncbi:allantoate amidohydrolase [Demequina lignilytica]|uniref:Allantoate amidohydrolase n=1 Tax=Demequina lignilytica TaxID=3051663 RepID=A0AB35MK49_9MICO|nr:allantoate amidohydrolase [Demequina sp. SYSU T0a273]MDN4484096.1 allantoate amidohydrolase [Demequina sp. SYSU T0a273]
MTRADQATAVDAAEVLARCDHLGTLTAVPGIIHRAYLTPEHAAANAATAAWMAAAGMDTWTDAAGNIVGRYEGADPEAPVLLLGSHLDTVPNAGRYDGPLGVMLAIAVVARLHERGERLPFPIEVIGFGDEEGTRFGSTLLGSRAVAGTWDPRWWELRDAEGVTLVEAFQTFGLDPSRVGEAAHDPQRVLGYLEAHIEQGPYLEEAGRPLGVVSAIAGAHRFQLTITGKAGHAGGVPMDRRRDALVGASQAVLDIERLAREMDCVATVGMIEVAPGAANVIPGEASFSLDVRAATDEGRDACWRAIQDAIQEFCQERRLVLSIEETHSAPAEAPAPRLVDAVRAGIAATGDDDPLVLLSKAGHDAMAIAAMTDWAMLFIACAGGVSHHPAEAVTEADVAAALDAFEAAVVSLVR